MGGHRVADASKNKITFQNEEFWIIIEPVKDSHVWIVTYVIGNPSFRIVGHLVWYKDLKPGSTMSVCNPPNGFMYQESSYVIDKIVRT